MKSVLLITLLLSGIVSADIYKCQRADGAIYYQDRSCVASDSETKLMHTVASIPKKTIKRLKKKYAKQAKQDVTQQKKIKRNLAKQKKQKETLQIKCDKVKQKIAKVESEYKNGYTAKRGIILDQRLAAYLNQKQQYCSK